MSEFKTVVYDPHHTICSSKNPSDYIYIIRKGMVKVSSRYGYNLKDLALFVEDDIFGNDELFFFCIEQDLIFQVLEPTQLYTIKKSSWLKLMNTVPDLNSQWQLQISRQKQLKVLWEQRFVKSKQGDSVLQLIQHNSKLKCKNRLNILFTFIGM